MNTELVPSSSAAEINRLHHAAQRSAGEALQMARQAGELLAEVKGKLAHGEFLPWLEVNCDVGERQAQRYMRLAKNWDALTANTTSTSDLGRLGIDGALTMLTVPKANNLPREVSFGADLMEGCALLADSTLDLEAVAASGEIEWAQVEAAADKLQALLEHMKLSPREHVDALMAVGDPVFDDANLAHEQGFSAGEPNPYRELASKSADPVVRAQAAFMAEIWDLAPGVRFTRTSMELPPAVSAKNWREVGRLLMSRMPEEMRRRP